MKYLAKILYTIIFLIHFISCEEIDVVELEIDYKDKIVVQSELISGEYFDGVYVTRTLPLNEIYDPQIADIPDATLFLIVNSIKVIPLHYRGSGKYESFSEFKVLSNQTYELYGEVGEERIYAKTIIPNIPIFNDQRFVPEGYLSSNVKQNLGEVYGALWLMANNRLSKPFDKSKDFFSISAFAETNYEETTVRTTPLNDDYLTSFYSDKTFLQIYSFDESYYRYFNTKNNNNPINDNFSQGGGPIEWNVKGNNVIGMFIGLAKTEFIQIKR